MRKNGMALVLLAGSLAIAGCGSPATPAAGPSSGAAPTVGAPAVGPGGGAGAPKAQPQAQAPAAKPATTLVSPPQPVAQGAPAATGGSTTGTTASVGGGGGGATPATVSNADAAGGSAPQAATVAGGMGYLANDFVVFTSDRYPGAGYGDIYVYDTLQDTVLAVVGVNTYANETNPRISDNGQWLVFQRDQGGVGYGCYGGFGQQDVLMYNMKLKLVNTLKGLNTELYDEFMPDITNDGTKIVYVSDESGFPRIHLYDVVTGDNYEVPGANRNFLDVTWPTISANGLKIAYGASAGPGVGYAFTGGPVFTGGALYPAQTDIYIYDVVNGVQLSPPFVNTAFDEYNPELCADGSRMLFVSNRLGTEDIFELNFDTGFTDNLSFLNTYDLDEQQPRYLGVGIDRLVFQIKPVDAPYPVSLRAYNRPAGLLDTLPVANQLFSNSGLRAPAPEVPAAL